MTHLRLEANDMDNISTDFFQHSQKLTSLIISNNQIQWLNSKIFYPLKSLTDIHLQHNPKFEMYCDYGFANSSLSPQLRSIYIHEMSHKCIHPWMKELEENRPDLKLNHELDKLCPMIEIEDLPLSVSQNTSLPIQFKGPNIFIKHKAYWISSNIDPCSDFREPYNFKVDDIGHQEIEIDNKGNAQFVFDKKGQFMLVYQYGEAPYLLYDQYVLDVV